MKKYIDKSIEIEASISKVWKVLTDFRYTKEWAKEFGSDISLVSDWKPGSPVLWKDADGKVVVEGNVTEIIPERLLRYTVFDVAMGRYEAAEDDGITFELSDIGDKTNLHVLHGDFGISQEMMGYYDMTLESWNDVLPKIKELAESR